MGLNYFPPSSPKKPLLPFPNFSYLQTMRTILFITLLFACGVTQAQTQLDGTWLAQKQEMGGKALPATAFAGQKLVIKDTNYTVMAESIDKGAVKVNGNQMDIYGRDGV